MPRRFGALLTLALGAAALLACNADVNEECLSGGCNDPAADAGTDTSCTAGAESGDFPCPVFEVLQRNCHRCHQDPPTGGAPFSLLTYDDTRLPYAGTTTLIFEQMKIQIQPGASPRMPFQSSMPSADFKVLDAWLDLCEANRKQGKGCSCPGDGC